MFALQEGTVDQALERRREARRCRLRANREQVARLDQEFMELVREADDEDDWQAAGCSSSAQWVAQLSRSDYRTAERITSTGEALRALPALDRAMSLGALTLDQTAAAAKNAAPETDAEIARLAVGMAPSEIALAVRKLVPPTVVDDQKIYERRSLSMTWAPGRRELVFSGRLPLEQGVVFEQAIWNIATEQRAEAKKESGETLAWQQSAADALATLAQSGGPSGDGVRRSAVTLVVHVSDEGPPVLEGAGPISFETAERLTCDARRLAIKPQDGDLVHSRVGRCASYAQRRALHHRSGHCQYPGCTARREPEAHHVLGVPRGGATVLCNLILLCPRHHKLLHDHHIHTSGSGEQPVFTDADGRAITANQPHAPPPG